MESDLRGRELALASVWEKGELYVVLTVKAIATVMRVAATDISRRKYMFVVVKMSSKNMSKLENVCRE